MIEPAREPLREHRASSDGRPDDSHDSDRASGVTQLHPTCAVCGLTIVNGETVVFDRGELIHVDCHWDRPTPRRPLSRAMRWPR